MVAAMLSVWKRQDTSYNTLTIIYYLQLICLQVECSYNDNIVQMFWVCKIFF